MRKTLISFLALLFPAFLFSQVNFDQWGIISPEELAMSVYPGDSSASAAILLDLGKTQIEDDGQRWLVRHKHYRRIKILNLADFDLTNLNILVRQGHADEALGKIKVQHTLPDGTTQKVNSDNFFLDKQSKYYSYMKVFVPELQNGSIVELQYELKSRDIFSLYEWYFHQSLPVRQSMISTHIDKAFDYMFLARAIQTFDFQKSETLVDGSVIQTLGMNDLPAIKEEDYMTSIDDFRAHVNFQLNVYHPENQEPKKVMVSWEQTARELRFRDDFGKQYEKTANFKLLWNAFESIYKPGGTALESASQVLDFVRSVMRWNEEFRVLTDKDINDAFERKSGSTAEMNLAVVALLQKIGLDAVPVLVSTRGHGKPYEENSFITQFNSVLAVLRLPGKNVLLDASNPFAPPGQLQTPHYNKRGWMVDGPQSAWIDIDAPESSLIWSGQLKVNEQGGVSGTFDLSSTGAQASRWRGMLASMTRKDFLKKIFATAYEELRFDSISVKSEAALDKPLVLKYKCDIPGASTVVNDYIYLKPVLDFFVTKNPFKALKREFPVDFAYPIRAQYVVNIELPLGYQVEEIPPPIKIIMPDKDGSIFFSCSKTTETQIQLVLKMVLQRSEYPPESYDILRQFFSLAEEKVNAQMVFKKSP